MLEIIETKKFEKDMKLAQKRGKPLSKVHAIVEILSKKEPLAGKYKDHKLVGKWGSFRECHIEPDWLLIYRVENDTLELVRTGSHSDLF